MNHGPSAQVVRLYSDYYLFLRQYDPLAPAPGTVAVLFRAEGRPPQGVPLKVTLDPDHLDTLPIEGRIIEASPETPAPAILNLPWEVTGVILQLLPEHTHLLDVRSPEEYRERAIKGAELLPFELVPTMAERRYPNKGDVYLLYCHAGPRAQEAARIMSRLGYSMVINCGGIGDPPKKPEAL